MCRPPLRCVARARPKSLQQRLQQLRAPPVCRAVQLNRAGTARRALSPCFFFCEKTFAGLPVGPVQFISGNLRDSAIKLPLSSCIKLTSWFAHVAVFAMGSTVALPIRAPISEGVILRYCYFHSYGVIHEAFVGFDSETISLGIYFTGPDGALGQRAPLCDAGVKDLLDALVQGKFTRVETIDVHMGGVSDVSVERIAQALKTNSTVTHVDLVSSLPISLLLLQSSFARSLQYVTRVVCTEPQLGYH